MHSTSGNIKLTSYNDANEIVNELFESLSLKISRKVRNMDERK